MPARNELGRWVGLKEVEFYPSANKLEPKTRILRVSERLYRRFCAHSKKYYTNPESYEIILENLLNCYDEHNKPDYMNFSRI
ncbi:MAG TPA: hypothetical protein VFK40_11245 [Nitrososphaeraceae archaeon]|nr:hypothetical protein [Nitrososphaeraceae archaeon]